MEIQTDTKFFDGLESEKHGYMHSLEKKFSQIKSHSRLPTARYFDDWSSEWTLPILATTESTYKKKIEMELHHQTTAQMWFWLPESALSDAYIE